jgi:hypothetical protein
LNQRDRDYRIVMTDAAAHARPIPRALIRAPTDKSVLDNATLLPACRKPPLTRVLYSDIDVSGAPLSSAHARSRTIRRCVCSDAWGLFFDNRRPAGDRSCMGWISAANIRVDRAVA